MINKRSYFNHVQLIDSECDTMRNQSMLSANQSTYSVNPPMLSTNNNFYRSPLRDRQNKMNLSNTPLRTGKASLSPLRMRKTDMTSNGNSNSFIGNNSIRMTKRKCNDSRIQQPQQPLCFNHAQKPAKFYVQAPDEIMHCCQKCAILLASQGFTVCKLQPSSNYQLQQSSSRKQNTQRKTEIQQFMGNLDMLQKQLKGIQNNLQERFTSSQHELSTELSRIQDYYEQFYQILNLHKNKVIQQMKDEYAKNNSQAIRTRKQLKQAVEETQSMKRDILQSYDDIIFVAEQNQYRPVITAYREKFQSFQQLSSESMTLPEMRVRKLNFINTDNACEALERGLQVEWEDVQRQEEESPVLEKEESEMGKYSRQSDLPENPVECVEKDEKFIKSSLKDLVGLFSSFEE